MNSNRKNVYRSSSSAFSSSHSGGNISPTTTEWLRTKTQNTKQPTRKRKTFRNRNSKIDLAASRWMPRRRNTAGSNAFISFLFQFHLVSIRIEIEIEIEIEKEKRYIDECKTCLETSGVGGATSTNCTQLCICIACRHRIRNAVNWLNIYVEFRDIVARTCECCCVVVDRQQRAAHWDYSYDFSLDNFVLFWNRWWFVCLFALPDDDDDASTFSNDGDAATKHKTKRELRFIENQRSKGNDDTSDGDWQWSEKAR